METSNNKTKVNDRKGIMYINLLMVYVLIFYPLIYRLYSTSNVVGSINKIVLGILIVFALINNRYFKKNLIITQTNKVLLISNIYIVCSLIIYSLFMSPGDVIKEVLYVIIPVLLYYIICSYNTNEQVNHMKLITYCLLIVIVIGFLHLLGLDFSQRFAEALDDHLGVNFCSFYSVLEMGYVAQLMFAMTLFEVSQVKLLNNNKWLFVIFFLFISIITLQRGCYLGLLSSSFIYIISKVETKTNRKKKIALILAGMLITIGIFIVIIFWDNVIVYINNIIGVDIVRFVKDEIENFNIKAVVDDRVEQAQISNMSNPLTFILGEGFGKYSANNSQTTRKMPDASYYRIFDELGLLGFCLFFAPYVMMLLKAVKRKNFFAIYFILQTFIAFYFNRTLWMIPLNFFIYSILSIIESEESCINCC